MNASMCAECVHVPCCLHISPQCILSRKHNDEWNRQTERMNAYGRKRDRETANKQCRIHTDVKCNVLIGSVELFDPFEQMPIEECCFVVVGAMEQHKHGNHRAVAAEATSKNNNNNDDDNNSGSKKRNNKYNNVQHEASERERANENVHRSLSFVRSSSSFT